MAIERPTPGWVDSELMEEFPRLAVYWAVAERPKAGELTGRSPAGVRRRLEMMSDRVTGARAVSLRQETVPAAYRIFFRQIGIDPDRQRTPPEEVALDRMFYGGLKSRGLLRDAITIATMETGLGVLGLDADAVSGDPGIRLSEEGETLGGGEGSRPLSRSQIMVADRSRALAVLFGDDDPACAVTKSTRRALLVAVRVGAVPEISVEEALWTIQNLVTGEA